MTKQILSIVFFATLILTFSSCNKNTDTISPNTIIGYKWNITKVEISGKTNGIDITQSVSLTSNQTGNYLQLSTNKSFEMSVGLAATSASAFTAKTLGVYSINNNTLSMTPNAVYMNGEPIDSSVAEAFSVGVFVISNLQSNSFEIQNTQTINANNYSTSKYYLSR